LLFTILTIIVKSDVCNGPITYSSDGKGAGSLDNFNYLLSCDVINGSLSLSQNGLKFTNITLPLLKEVTGDLEISANNYLRSINGLTSLTKVAGSLTIRDNKKATQISFPVLTYVGGALSITSNDIVTTLSGFNALTFVDSLTIAENNKVLDLDFLNLKSVNTLDIGFSTLNGISGFGNLTTAQYISIHDNTLTKLTGFNKLTSSPKIEIYTNAKLTNISGFANLTTVAELSIIDNAVLLEFNGLSKVQQSTTISIKDNLLLKNVQGFQNLQSPVDSFNIENNPELDNVDGLCKLTSVTQYFTITGNSKLRHLNGLASLTKAEVLEIKNNIALNSLEGLTSLTESSFIDIAGNQALCGTFRSNIQKKPQLESSVVTIECCGDGKVDATNQEVCETDTLGCSKKCIPCASLPNNGTNDCNCPASPCTGYGYCLYNGTCLNDMNFVTKGLCGNPIPGYTVPSTSASTTSGSVTEPTIDETTCTINSSEFRCIVVSKDMDFTGKPELTARNNLVINGAIVKIDSATHIHVLGSLIIKKNSAIRVDNKNFQNHKTSDVFEYTRVEGRFDNITFTESNNCHSYRATYGKTALSIHFVNSCEDQSKVGSSITALIVMIGLSSVGGGVLFWYVKNRKRQERRQAGLGNK